MRTIVKHVLWGALLAGGLSLLGATAANAAETSGEDSVLGGTQALIDVVVPVDLSDNAISLLGDSTAANTTSSAPADASAATSTESSTDGADSLLGGTQALIEAVVPVNITGNAISLIGDSNTANKTDGTTSDAPASPDTDAVTDGADGITSGTQVIAPVTVPVDVTGNAISLIGDSNTANETDGTTVDAPASPDTDAVTDGLSSLLGGTQVLLPISVPVSLSGNAISLVGDSTSTATGTDPGTNPGTDPGTESGGTDPGTDSGTNPGTEAGTDPGTTPGTAPGTTPEPGSMATPQPAALISTDAAVRSGALAETGGTSDPTAAVLAALLLAVGAGLLRRRSRA